MRLFIGIDFSDENKEIIIEKIKHCQGKVVKKENLHLTLVFLGEIAQTKIDQIIHVLKKVNSVPFILTANKTNILKDILVLEINKTKELIDLQAKLEKEILSSGFLIDSRLYYPHVSLVRKYQKKDISLFNITEKVNKIVLFWSHHQDGNLVYEHIYCHYL